MFGKRLRELRESNGYSMDKLIEIYNRTYGGKMNKSTLSRYENGLQEPMYTVVVNLAKLFNVSVDYMTCATQAPPDQTSLSPIYITNQADNPIEENKPDSAGLEENVIIYHRDGKTVKKKMSKEQMKMLSSMIDAIPDEDNPDL